MRGLIRDLTDGLAQQMYLWGRDVRHPDGNALVRAGLQRIARIENNGEGTSLYRIERENGWIELHGFCAGWRPHDPQAEGMLYIRRCHRIFLASGQMTPGRYDMSRLRSGSIDELATVCNPFLRWWTEYENWARQELGSAWRTDCWRDYVKLRHARPWLSPVQAVDWLLAFLENPRTANRPRDLLRSQTPAAATACPPACGSPASNPKSHTTLHSGFKFASGHLRCAPVQSSSLSYPSTFNTQPSTKS